jgi:hypothetical protein
MVRAEDLIYWFVTVKHATDPLEISRRRPQSLLDELLHKF